MSFVNWIFETIASEDVIDSYFILSDLADIYLTDADHCEISYYDSMANTKGREQPLEHHTPIGKQVF